MCEFCPNVPSTICRVCSTEVGDVVVDEQPAKQPFLVVQLDEAQAYYVRLTIETALRHGSLAQKSLEPLLALLKGR